MPFTSTDKVSDTFADLSSIRSLIIVKCFASPAAHEENVLQATRQLKGSGQGFGTEQSKERVIACPQETQVILFISVFGRIVLLGQKGWGKGSGFSSYLFRGAFCIEFLCRALSPSIVSVSL